MPPVVLLLLAVDVVHVTSRALNDAAVSLFQKLCPGAEHQRTRRAALHAGRHVPLQLPVVAHVALVDAGIELVPFETGHQERAGHHAVTASQTEIAVPHYGPLRGLLERADRTA